MEVHYHQGIFFGHSFKNVKIEGYIQDIFDIVYYYFALSTFLIAWALYYFCQWDCFLWFAAQFFSHNEMTA